MTMDGDSPVLSWVHFGDLHITEAGLQNHTDMLSLIECANQNLSGGVDFAILPGDNADSGSEAQFRLVRDAVERLNMPLRIIPGDHDFHSRGLGGFHAVLGAAPLPAAHSVAGCRCLFLDTVSAGSGGPDFRIGESQLAWLRAELQAAQAGGQRPVVFMHVYPADLTDAAAATAGLFLEYRVACVDMGHTHYNELANDGRTIFMATRSTGQIEEGAVGFSVAAVDCGVVSWRFQPLSCGWPLVMVTHPADRRLITDASQVANDHVKVRVKAWGAVPVSGVVALSDDGCITPLARHPRDPSLWQGVFDVTGLSDGIHRLQVLAHDQAGATGTDTIEIRVSRDGTYTPSRRHADGSDRDAIGAWPEKHILGTQLGPNRNGRQW